MDCLSYLRVSSAGQAADDRDGLPRQRDAIARYAAANGLSIIQEYVDAGLSGKLELENRPGLATCLERVDNSEVKLVLVESSDRLARDSVVAELVIRQFQKAGGKVLTASGVDLTEGSEQNPTAKFIRQILAAVAEMDRSLICLKLKAARERKGKAGLRPVGRLGYGQRGNKGAEYEGDVKLVARVLELYDQRTNHEAIADTLFAEGFRTRKGTRMSRVQVGRILRSRWVPPQNNELPLIPASPQL